MAEAPHARAPPRTRSRPPGLRELCADAGLRTNGRKAELVERLLEHEAAAPSGRAAPAA